MVEHASRRERPEDDTSAQRFAQPIAAILALAFLAMGIAGFVPGATGNLGGLAFAGPVSEALLFGLFQVSGLHNLIHIAFGVAGLALATVAARAIGFLVVGGSGYLMMSIYGQLAGHDSAANFVPLNAADNWLHLGLAVGMIGIGLVLRLLPGDS